MFLNKTLLLAVIATAPVLVWAMDDAPQAPQTTADVLASISADEWRTPSTENILLMTTENGLVTIELAPQFAPKHVANIRRIVAAGLFDDANIVRVQENYVVQWGIGEGSLPEGAETTLEMETRRPYSTGNEVTWLPDTDTYAGHAGFWDGFPVGINVFKKQANLAHCYGMVGVGRGNPANSGNGSELYVVSGHSPRHLDHNVTLVGRVLSGMELLTVLPRGNGPLGFYTEEQVKPKILKIELASRVPEYVAPQLLRTDSDSFVDLIAARRTRAEDWFLAPTGKLEVCNMMLPQK